MFVKVLNLMTSTIRIRVYKTFLTILAEINLLLNFYNIMTSTFASNKNLIKILIDLISTSEDQRELIDQLKNENELLKKELVQIQKDLDRSKSGRWASILVSVSHLIFSIWNGWGNKPVSAGNDADDLNIFIKAAKAVVKEKQD